MRFHVVFFAVFVCGCASAREAEISPLVAEGKANELAAVAKHRDERLHVTGIVVTAGLRKVDETVVSHGPSFLPGAPFQSVESTQSAEYPYLYLADPNDRTSGALLICYFRPEQLEAIAPVTPGTRIGVTGTFQGYDPRASVLVLNACDVD